MHGMATHEVAEQGVLVIRGAAADLVAGIEITQRHLDAAGLEVRVQGVTQKRPDVLELRVAGGVLFAARTE